MNVWFELNQKQLKFKSGTVPPSESQMIIKALLDLNRRLKKLEGLQ